MIGKFLQQQRIVKLFQEENAAPGQCYKAGVVPFLRRADGEFSYYLMVPVPRQPGLGAPSFQICKGTRMHLVPGAGWQDLRSGGDTPHEKEALSVTALREGMEELGMTLPPVRRMYELGPYDFSSAKTGVVRQMWLFASEMAGEGGFLPDEAVAGVTLERRWMTLSEAASAARADHYAILSDIEKKLAAHHE